MSEIANVLNSNPVPLASVHNPEDVVPPSGLSDDNQKVYDNMVRYMKLKLQRPFTAPKIVMLIAGGIIFLAKVKTMSGIEKKDLVLHALRETVQHSTYINGSEKADILILVDTFGDGLIEHLVDFALDGVTFIKNKLKRISWCPDCVRGGNENANSHARSVVFADICNSDEYRTLKEYLKLKLQRPVTDPKIITVVASGVKHIEHYHSLSGVEKKAIVIHAVRDVILESDLIPYENKTKSLTVVDTFADDTIDYLVDFGKNMYLKVKKGCCKK